MINNHQGGTSIGSCASGFGTCCFVSQKTCGGTISENITYIQNPGYGGSYDGSSSCGYIIKQVRCHLILENQSSATYSNKFSLQMADDICFIRLDFEKFITVEPATDGGCPDSFLQVFKTIHLYIAITVFISNIIIFQCR